MRSYGPASKFFYFRVGSLRACVVLSGQLRIFVQPDVRSQISNCEVNANVYMFDEPSSYLDVRGCEYSLVFTLKSSSLFVPLDWRTSDVHAAEAVSDRRSYVVLRVFM